MPVRSCASRKSCWYCGSTVRIRSMSPLASRRRNVARVGNVALDQPLERAVVLHPREEAVEILAQAGIRVGNGPREAAAWRRPVNATSKSR